ncbi:uracil-DNA glycosylase-like protein [Cyathus striatus]|nr:uracil-DNA glycosylase-like protein [Cyathus striatus]
MSNNTEQADDLQLCSVEGLETRSLTSGAFKGKPGHIEETTVITAVKRQRTLMQMFSKSDGASEPSTKKLKLASDLHAPGNRSTSQNTRTSSSTSSLAGAKISIPKLNSIPFSLLAFRESLSEEESQLLELECQVMGKSWLKLLKDEIRKPYFIALKRFLREEGVQGINDTSPVLKIYPGPRNIYTWSNTPVGKIKVVIVGQDPYHGPGQAHGLCFSVPQGVAIPPSLRNIYEELRAEYPHFQPPKHGNLMAWATHGVLMLNTCLTVREGKPGSHSNKGWEQFTDKVVDVVDRYGGANLPGATADIHDGHGIGRGVVFLAWGAWATKRVAKLNKEKHLILTSAHPSPLSAHRGFLGNGHFKTANEWLERKYGSAGKVDWCTLDTSGPSTH